MAVDVVMPQMGESIAEGTIVRWIKKVGDKVDRDEPLFEISTDKVDAEIPSPAAGVVSEIRVKEGETVPVNSVVAVIGSSVTAAAPQPKAAESTPTAPANTPAEPPRPATQGDGTPAAASAAPAPSGGEALRPSAASAPAAAAAPAPASAEETIRQRSSPLVRKIA
jgi:2-oxoglutarate dehydrogenase E2 component (dihydrolipoamide succinyltransferase)